MRKLAMLPVAMLAAGLMVASPALAAAKKSNASNTPLTDAVIIGCDQLSHPPAQALCKLLGVVALPLFGLEQLGSAIKKQTTDDEDEDD